MAPEPIPDALREAGRFLAPDAPVVVTGCAGFIGSHLTEALLALGCRVTGVDVLTDYYDPALKRENLAGCRGHSAFTWLEADLLDLDPVDLLSGQAAVFHLAAQAGVRASWGEHFREYTDRNLLATQRLLEACRHPAVAGTLQRFVYSSSSSVYGDRQDLPVAETARPQPFSPYGVTKLAAEHLCVLYSGNFGVPTTSLRYFTVYGPRQRPDMAFRKFIEAALDGRPWEVYGDGSQTRDFTFVADAVRANLLAVGAPGDWAVYNVGGGTRISLGEALEQLQALLAELAPGTPVTVIHREWEKGDVHDTWADTARITADLDFRPRVAFPDGLRAEVAWAVGRRSRRDG